MDRETIRKRANYFGKNKRALHFHKVLVRGGYLSDELFWLGYSEELRLHSLLYSEPISEEPTKEAFRFCPTKQKKVKTHLERVGWCFSLETTPRRNAALVSKINTESLEILKKIAKTPFIDAGVEHKEHKEKQKVEIRFEEGLREPGTAIHLTVDDKPVWRDCALLFFELARHFWVAEKERDVTRMRKVLDGLQRFYDAEAKKENSQVFVISCFGVLQRAREAVGPGRKTT